MPPQLWQPTSGILMTNDISDTNPEDAVACFALSKNDSYVMSASGGKISLFNMMTFKVIWFILNLFIYFFKFRYTSDLFVSLYADYDYIHGPATCSNLSGVPSTR